MSQVHSALVWIPSRVSHPLSDRPACRPELTVPLGSSTPFNGIPQLAPCDAGCPFPAPVPLSGFLNLSAVSWQARVPRPCFMPQPFLGCLPSELSPRWNRGRLSTPPAPLRSSTALPARPHASRSPALSPTPRPFRPRCLAPCTAHGFPFRVALPPLSGHPGLRVAQPSRTDSFTRFEAFLLQRIRSRQRRRTHADGRCSLGFLPLQRSLLNLGASTRPGPSTCAPAPETAHVKQATPVTSDREDRQPSRPGEASPQRWSEDRPGTRRLPASLRVVLVGSLRPPSGPRRTASRRRLLLPLALSRPAGEPTAPLRPSELRSARQVTALRRDPSASHEVWCLVVDLSI